MDRRQEDGEVDVVGGGIAADDPTRKIVCGLKRSSAKASGRSRRSPCARSRCGRGGRQMCLLRRTIRQEWTRAWGRHPFRRRRWMSMWMARSTSSLSTRTSAYLLHHRVSPSPCLHAFAPHLHHRRPMECLQVPRPARASRASCRNTRTLWTRVRLGFPLARVRMWRCSSTETCLAYNGGGRRRRRSGERRARNQQGCVRGCGCGCNTLCRRSRRHVPICGIRDAAAASGGNSVAALALR
ncbi:hypothetical protein B0H19DRAFT_160436 [Mycena capillaripes]|nr:hypothetical protein B0H19DRAFT_160436 [Mycena capillaripes]